MFLSALVLLRYVDKLWVLYVLYVLLRRLPL